MEKSITITVKDNQINIETEMESYEVVGLLTGVLQHYNAENLLPTISKMVDKYMEEQQEKTE